MKLKKNHRGAYFEWDELKSPAYMALTGKSPQVLGLIFAKRQIVKIKGKPGRGKTKVIENNGEIALTYQEAEQYGIKIQQYSRALDQLVAFGWIDVQVIGIGAGRAKNLFTVSQRWRNFGRDDFEYVQRQKRIQPHRFPKGHSFGGTHGTS